MYIYNIVFIQFKKKKLYLLKFFIKILGMIKIHFLNLSNREHLKLMDIFLILFLCHLSSLNINHNQHYQNFA